MSKIIITAQYESTNLVRRKSWFQVPSMVNSTEELTIIRKSTIFICFRFRYGENEYFKKKSVHLQTNRLLADLVTVY